LEKKDHALQGELSEMFSRYPKKEHDEIMDGFSWDLHLNQNKYPHLHRESLIITVFNFLEHQLNSLCHIFYESIDSCLKVKDIKGQGVERALTFLSKVAKVDFSRFGPEMLMIKGVNSLRNVIVHNGGYLPKNTDAKVNDFVKKERHLSGVEGAGISIDPEFIGSFIDTLLSFFKKLDVEIQKHIQEFNNQKESE